MKLVPLAIGLQVFWVGLLHRPGASPSILTDLLLCAPILILAAVLYRREV